MLNTIKSWFRYSNDPALRIAIIGNCQARPLGTYIRHLLPRATILEPVIVHLARPEEEDSVYERLHGADVIFAQLVNDNYHTPYVATNRIIENHGSKVIPWVNLYYRGYNPELQYWREFKGDARLNPLGDYHITTIINGVLEGVTAEEILHRLSDHDWNQEHYAGVADASMHELKQREALTPVSITDFIEEHKQNAKLFFTYNHPSRLLLLEYICRLLEYAGLGRLDKRKAQHLPEFLNAIELPINPAWYGSFQSPGRYYKGRLKDVNGTFKPVEMSETDLVYFFVDYYKNMAQ